jgi:hypothetical protein
MKITITVGSVILEAELNDTITAGKIADILPVRSAFNLWGDEIYFTVPVEAQLDETAKEEVNTGDLGYWPTGKAFCVFFGPTPISSPDKIIPASAVNIIGRIIGDAKKLKQTMNTTNNITLQRQL